MEAKSTGFQDLPGSWQWPDDLPAEESNERASKHQATATPISDDDGPSASSSKPQAESHETESRTDSKRRRRWSPRTCRICLETVHPTFRERAEGVPGFLQGSPSVVYESEEGRLLRPCSCKGSSKYVHEACLQAWRHADSSYGARNYWECPTCRFRYRLERLSWGHWISSTTTQIALTLLIFLVATFVLGFIADPIINLYFDPFNTISPFSGYPLDEIQILADSKPSWAEHFAKGLASLGLLGFVKMIFTMPLNWLNLRTGRWSGSGRETGRDRIANTTWVVIMIGLFTFLYTVWKIVRAMSRRFLESASERVMDVHGDVDDNEDDEDELNEQDTHEGRAE